MSFIQKFENRSFESKISILSDLISKRIPISMPDVQRNAEAWEPKDATELFDSICQIADSYPGTYVPSVMYFLGPVVIHEITEEKNVVRRDFFDGQQRITTLTLMLCALRDYYYWKSNKLSDIVKMDEAISAGWPRTLDGYEQYQFAKSRYNEDITYSQFIQKEFGWEINSDEYESFQKYLVGTTDNPLLGKINFDDEMNRYIKHLINNEPGKSEKSLIKKENFDSKRSSWLIHKTLAWPCDNQGITQYLDASNATGNNQISHDKWFTEFANSADANGWGKTHEDILKYFSAQKINPKYPSRHSIEKQTNNHSNISKAKELGWGNDVMGFLLSVADIKNSNFKKQKEVLKEEYDKFVALRNSSGKKVFLKDVETETDPITGKKFPKTKQDPTSGEKIPLPREEIKPLEQIKWAAQNDFEDPTGYEKIPNLLSAAIKINRYILWKENNEYLPKLSLRENTRDATYLKSIQNFPETPLKGAKMRPFEYPPGHSLNVKYSNLVDKPKTMPNIYSKGGQKTTRLYKNYDAIMLKIDEIFNENATRYSYCTDESYYDLEKKRRIDKFKEIKNFYNSPIIGYRHNHEQWRKSCEKLWQIYFSLLQYCTFSDIRIVDNEQEAYKIFLNMNSKGKPLTFFDICRAKILIEIDDANSKKIAKNKLDHIEAKIGNKGTRKDIFMYASWNSREGDGAKKSAKVVQDLIFSKISSSDDGQLLEYLEELTQDLDYYLWASSAALIPKNIIENYTHVDLIGRTTKVLSKQTIPLKMSFFRMGYNGNDFYKLHKFIEGTWIFIAGLTETAGSKTEAFWVNCCKEINDSTDLDDALTRLSTLLSERSEYQNFSMENWRNRMLTPELLKDKENPVQLILRKIEYSLQPLNLTTKPGGLKDPDQLNVEHILPKNPFTIDYKDDNGIEWDTHFDDANLNSNLWLLGNMTLLHSANNQKILKSKTFQFKCENGYRPYDKEKDGSKEDYESGKKTPLFASEQLNIHGDNGLYSNYHTRPWTPESILKRTRELIVLMIDQFDIFNFTQDELKINGWEDDDRSLFNEIYIHSGKIVTKLEYQKILEDFNKKKDLALNFIKDRLSVLNSEMSLQEVVNWAGGKMLSLQDDADYQGEDIEYGWIRPDEILDCCTDIYPFLLKDVDDAKYLLKKNINDEKWPVRIMAKSAMHMLSISTGDKDQFASGSDSLFALSEFIDDLLYEDPDPTEAR